MKQPKKVKQKQFKKVELPKQVKHPKQFNQVKQFMQVNQPKQVKLSKQVKQPKQVKQQKKFKRTTNAIGNQSHSSKWSNQSWSKPKQVKQNKPPRYDCTLRPNFELVGHEEARRFRIPDVVRKGKEPCVPV